jgi:CheY-like chemotaxis protein/anti-sigma regulatory factor (Ser/Thr protein kinase)
MPTILVVDDLASDRRLVGGLIMTDEHLRVEFAVNGVEALERVARQQPDLVVTDLMMPEMDGLLLVSQLRMKYRSLPIILMTSQGSEEIAVKALEQGASSYVPKKLLPRYLLSTVQRLLAVVIEQRNRQRLIGSMMASECTFELENDSALVRSLIGYVQESLAHMGLFDEVELLRISVALEEAMVNALYHGNLEIGSELRGEDDEAYRKLVQQRLDEPPYSDRQIHLQTKFSAFQAAFIVRDEGPGFDIRKLPDPTDPENLEKASGRGVLLMRAFMDEVMYNETGNQVTLIKRTRLALDS